MKSDTCTGEMEVGTVKIAEDSDFFMLRNLIDNNEEWKLEYNKGDESKVWTHTICSKSNVQMVKIHTEFEKVSASTLFDVLHDPDYRKEWDTHMIESTEIGYLNPNNDVGYYAMSCPTPMKNRDFVLQRSWLDMGDEKMILNHSIYHKSYPPRKGYVRAISHLTGFLIRPSDKGCFLGYVSQTDPRGKIPPWLVNKVTQIFAPKLVKQLKKAAEGYPIWKAKQKEPCYKPWIYPEQTLLSPRVKICDVSEKRMYFSTRNGFCERR
ncbi:START domain-containing protein 10 isoform X2 [Agrilus planipennis]|uniref:START domain-containing protein 10 n=1 Tax=Agrilus planipennis TaxID=224129 RepID=A0A1W4X012_AGRPL|nr:START domain-containing protein 10 isoform X2 [Agrilus planipennis]